MENAITAALSKQLILARALDVAANNVANQTTAGFKSEHANFREYVSRVANPEGGDETVSLVSDADSYTDFTAGGLEPTNAPLDFAIDGDGFFGVSTNSGIQYTRDGHFQLNAFGELTTRDGALVLDDTSSSILIDPEIGPILMSREGELQQDGIPIAKLGVFKFEDQSVLQRTGANRFATDAEPTGEARAVVRQGFIEISNVSPMVAMTNMIEIMRAYESAAQVIETSSELARNAVQTLTEA
ncbi:MAG: flagellar hook-basal body complex protein [Marinicaulis sp.]|nr:flagellar hook-basal body complex protein [Marinicaulis sp.]